MTQRLSYSTSPRSFIRKIISMSFTTITTKPAVWTLGSSHSVWNNTGEISPFLPLVLQRPVQTPKCGKSLSWVQTGQFGPWVQVFVERSRYPCPFPFFVPFPSLDEILPTKEQALSLRRRRRKGTPTLVSSGGVYRRAPRNLGGSPGGVPARPPRGLP